MSYIDVQWFHNFESEPIRLVSELNEDRLETRKLEFFRDGKVGFASASSSSSGTDLGLMDVPMLAEINLDPQFRGVEISANEFEVLWEKYAGRV